MESRRILMEIIKGKVKSALKVVVYGPEGIGKSTFASQFPDPLFIDTEGSTKQLDVARFEKPSSWEMLLAQIQYVKQNPTVCKTLVIDTLDWAEQLCIASVCAQHDKKGIEDFGYGNGYVYVKETFGKFLNSLEEVIEKGINVVVTAHAQLRKFEQPDEVGAYDRWELKLGKKTSSQTSPLVKEWADMVLFANYKTYSVSADDKGKKFKAQGGKRIMHTTHHPCWDAKNRFGLAEELPFEYAQIAHCITGNASTSSTPAVENPPIIQQPTAKAVIDKANEVGIPTDLLKDTVPIYTPPAVDVEGVPKPLADLMIANNVTKENIQAVVAPKGYFPPDMPVENLPTEFVNGVLVGAWEQVFEQIKQLSNYIPF